MLENSVAMTSAITMFYFESCGVKVHVTVCSLFLLGDGHDAESSV